MKNQIINPNSPDKSGYIAYPNKNDRPIPYVKVSGELRDKFSAIREDIFDLGEYMFIPEDLYYEAML